MSSLAAAAWRYARARNRLRRPLQTGLAVNNTCNTFCEMCNIWRARPKQALSLEQLRRIFSGPLFADCATVSLTGGEPTMRRDLATIPVTLAEVMPRLASVNLTSNGYLTDKIVDDLSYFLPYLERRGVRFSINLSIDGVGEVHDRVRANPGAFDRLERTVDRLLELKRRRPFNLALACTFTRSNCADADNVLAWARRREVYVIFRNAFTIKRIENLESFDSFAPTDEQLASLAGFYRRLLARYERSHSRRLYYRMLLDMMRGAERTIPCLYRKSGLFIDHLGEMYVCSVFSEPIGSALAEDAERLYFDSLGHRRELAAGDCRRCSHDVTLYTSLADQVRDRLASRLSGIHR